MPFVRKKREKQDWKKTTFLVVASHKIDVVDCLKTIQLFSSSSQMSNKKDKSPKNLTLEKNVTESPPLFPSLPPPAIGVGDEMPFDFETSVAKSMNAHLGTQPVPSQIQEHSSFLYSKVSNVGRKVSSPGQPARTNDVSPRQGHIPLRPPLVKRNVTASSVQTSVYGLPEEDALLRNLEDRDPMHRNADTGGNILPGIPDELLDVITKEDEIRRTVPSRPGPNSIIRKTSGDQSTTSGRLTSPEVVEHLKKHKRQLTVEQALFGLTAALSAVRQDEATSGTVPGRNEAGHSRNNTADSVERLAQTAEVMFGKGFLRSRTKLKTTGSPSGSEPTVNKAATAGGSPVPATAQGGQRLDSNDTLGGPALDAKARWSAIQANLDMRKKFDISVEPENDDSDELKGVDVELGDNSPNPVNATGGESANEDRDPSQKTNTNRPGTKLLGALAGPFHHLPYAENIMKEWDLFSSFLNPRKTTMFAWARYITIYLWLPSLAVAAILYHFVDNPHTGKGPWNEGDSQLNATDTAEDGPVEKVENKASISWWIIFICLREVGIVIIAKCVEAVVVEFLAIQSLAVLNSFGPGLTLLLVQSKGWPFLTSTWGILNLLLVNGNTPFNRQWLFWQDLWGLFNERNPSGDVTNALWFFRISVITSILGVVVSIKRVMVGVYLGRQTFGMYNAGWFRGTNTV
jgi:hypothetical protein